MFRIRLLIFLGVCVLGASASWADEVGYVDCSNHSDATQVFGKPRKSPDVVASLPCGERFTILVYGFYFSRIQTKDGQIGYIYSSLIAVDRGLASVQQTPSLQATSEKTKIPSTRTLDAKPAPAAPAQPQVAVTQPQVNAAQPPQTAEPTPTLPPPASAAPASSSAASPSQTQEAAATPAQTDQPVSTPPAASSTQPAVASQPAAGQSESTPSTPVQPATTPAAEIATPAPAPAPASTTSEVAAPAAQPDAPAPAEAQPTAQPQPAPAQPAPVQPAPVIRPADTRDSWERPNPSVRRPPLVELYGGFAYNRLQGASGYSSTNFNGALGSFGVNVRPWLQVVGDSSYNFVTVSGTKNVLYANHYGPRFYYRGLRRLNITPFAEALVGGSRSDVTPSGGSTTSQNCISYKVGGGIDYRASRRWEVRVIDFDYYRTSFGTNTQQTNYWISAGVVLRLFGGSNE